MTKNYLSINLSAKKEKAEPVVPPKLFSIEAVFGSLDTGKAYSLQRQAV
jgi:hypothetical protein